MDAPPDGLHPRRPPTEEAGNGCPFCAAPGKSDAEGLIVHRGEHCYVVMNLFPYNPGHVLVCPYRHVSLYVDLSDEETAEFTALTKQAIRALQAASEPHGFNLGMNQGAVAGAGVAAHLHQHIVPRWSGDSTSCRSSGRPRPCPCCSRRPAGASSPAGPDAGADPAGRGQVGRSGGPEVSTLCSPCSTDSSARR